MDLRQRDSSGRRPDAGWGTAETVSRAQSGVCCFVVFGGAAATGGGGSGGGRAGCPFRRCTGGQRRQHWYGTAEAVDGLESSKSGVEAPLWL